MEKNTQKYLSYKEAWSRIKDANDKGFYLESITICESIISDRLLSYICGVLPNSNANTRTPFAKLIQIWRKQAVDLPFINGKDLGRAVDEWREKRNEIIHGLTKSTPGMPTTSVKKFIAVAEETALYGAKLARAVLNWHRIEKNKQKKAKSSRS